jgi:hypothetical protein
VLAESLRDVTRGRSAGTVIGLANPDHGVLVAHDQGAAAGHELADAARASLLVRLQPGDTGASVVAGIGDPSILADARGSYRQAKQAARVAATIGRAGPVARWQDLGVYRTLAQLPAGADAAASLDPRLATLFDQADGPVITTWRPTSISPVTRRPAPSGSACTAARCTTGFRKRNEQPGWTCAERV